MNVKSVFILYSSCNLYLVFEISAHTASDLWKFCLISSQQFSFFLSGFTKWHSGRGRGNCPQNFWLSENCPNILCLWEIFRPKTKFEAENHNFEENLGAKLKFLSTHNLLCWNLQLSIGKCNFLPCLLFKPTLTWNDQIWKNRSVRRKIVCVYVCVCVAMSVLVLHLVVFFLVIRNLLCSCVIYLRTDRWNMSVSDMFWNQWYTLCLKKDPWHYRL